MGYFVPTTTNNQPSKLNDYVHTYVHVSYVDCYYLQAAQNVELLCTISYVVRICELYVRIEKREKYCEAFVYQSKSFQNEG